MNEFTPPPDRKVTYKALNSEAVAAARAAAGAAGLTTEDWLSRVILENAQANGIITSAADAGIPEIPQPAARADPGGAEAGADRPAVVSSLATHIHQAKEAASQAGMPVETWLNRAIIDSARAQAVPSGYEEIITDDPIGPVVPQQPARPFVPPASPQHHPVGIPTAADADTAAPTREQPAAPSLREDLVTPSIAKSAQATAAPTAATRPAPTRTEPAAHEAFPDIRRPAEIAAAHAQSEAPAADVAAAGVNEDGVPGAQVRRNMSAAMSGNDPLQERLARIVAARRDEQARFDHPDDPPMILASRPREKGAAQSKAPHLADFDEVDRRSHSGNLSWFWVTMMIILTAFAGIIWALPFIGDPQGVSSQVSIARATSVTIPATKQKAAAAAPRTNDGTVLPKPVRENFAAWRKAAEAGNHPAQIAVARLMIAGGRGIPRDPVAAVKLLRDAADRGNRPQAQFLLAYLLERGIGVKEKSFVDATLYYQKAAAQGYMPAVTEVGIAFLHGIGVRRDYQKAFRYLERAAEAGQAKAQFRLGYAYENGIGVRKDKIVALKWYILAAERRHAGATARIEDISHKTKKAEREKATELARQFNRRYRNISRAQTPN